MNPDLKAKWIAALRSGEYEQGLGRLRREDSYCCLGVLCEISGTGEWIDEETFRFRRSECVVFLPPSFSRMAGLTAAESKLIWMNDRGDSFAHIADWIEANL